MTRWLGADELTLTVPLAPPRTTTRIPENRRNPPRLTTKDGILSRAISVPWRAPITPQIASAASTAAHHGQSGPGCWTSLKAITPPISATAPVDRSTSARSRTAVSAIASTMYTVLSPKMYTRLLGRRKACSGVMTSKTTATITMARTTGRTPLLPLRTRSHEALRYWPSDWAMSSGGTSAAATLASRVRSSVPAPAVPAGVSLWSAVTGTSRFWPYSSSLAINGSGYIVQPPVGGTSHPPLHT